MRLRLNTTLRAALIAAITAVGFTLSQAEAADMTLANIMNQGQNTIIWGDSGADLTEASAICTTADVRSVNAYENSFRAVDTNVGSSTADPVYTYTLTFTTGESVDATLSKVTADFLTFNGQNAPHNATNYINVAWTLNGGEQSLAGTSSNVELLFRSTATGGTAGYTSSGEGETLTFDTSDPSHYCGGTAIFDFTDFSLAANTEYTLTIGVTRVTTTGFFAGIGNIALINTIPTLTSTWNGTSAHHTWSDAASWKNDEAFQPGSIAVFDNTANHKTVTITTAETAESITVDGAAYIFEGSGSVTAGTLSFTNDGSLSLDTTLDLGNTTNLAELSKVTVTQNGTLKVVAGSHSVINLNAASTGTLEIKSGSVSNTCAIGTSAATLKLDSGTALYFDNNGNHELNYNLALGGDATVEVYGSSYHSNGVTISGNVSGSGHKLTKNDVGNLDFTGNVELGTLLLNSNSKVTLSGSSSQLASAEVNDGTLQINSATTISGKLYGKKGTITIGDDTHNVVVKTARVELGDNNPAATSTLNVAANSVLWVTSSSTETGYKEAGLVLGEWSTQTTVNLMGTLIADQVSATAGDSGYVMNINGGTALLKGLQRKEGNRKQEINVTSGGRLILGENGIVGSNTGSDVTLTVNDGTIGIYADSVTIDKAIAVSGATTFDTQEYTVNEAVITQGETGGALTVSGNLTGDGTIIKTGKGTLELSGTANVLTHTIAANAGTLKLSGSFEIGDITPTGGEIRYDDGQHTGNGYETATGKVVVYSGEGAVETTGGMFTYRGKGVELVEGAYTTSGQQDTTTYYINTDTDSYNWIDTNKKAALTGGIVVKANATLEVDKNMDLSLVATSSAGTVMIDSGYVVNAADGRKVTLAGEGTYALAEGAKSLGSDIVLGDNWTGIVRLTAANHNNIDLSQFVKGTSSTIELKGFTGWTDNWSGTITQNIKLTNNGDNAAWSNGAFSSSGQPEATFAGTWSGTGTFKRTSGNNMHYKYTGDISAWEGKFLMESGNTRLTFAGSASAVNAEIAKDGGTLNVVVDNDAVFSKSVTADSLTVNASKSATFNGTATFGSVTQNDGASITVGAEGALTIGGGSLATTAITNNGTVTFSGNITATDFEVTEGGTNYTDVNGNVTTDGNGFEGTTGSSITIVNNGTDATLNPAGHTVTQNGVVYTIQADGTATTEGGSVVYTTYYQKNGAVATSDIEEYASGKGLFMFAYVSDKGILNVDSGVGGIYATGGEVNFADGGSTDRLDIAENAKVSGLTDYSIMNITAGKTATMSDGLTVGQAAFSSTEGGVQVTNNGETDTVYTKENADMAVAADALTFSQGAESALTIANAVSVKKITNESGKDLVLNQLVSSELQEVSALSGNIELVAQTQGITIDNLVIKENQQLYVHDGQGVECTVTVSETLQGGSATLLANLTLVGGAKLDVNGGHVAGGDMNALTLGSMLTFDFSENQLVNLDDVTIAALNQLAEGQYLDLIVAAEGTQLDYAGAQTGMNYDDLFSRVGGVEGIYTVYAHGDAFGLVKGSQVPEPTTGTLSLLALAALAARRRRK